MLIYFLTEMGRPLLDRVEGKSNVTYLFISA